MATDVLRGRLLLWGTAFAAAAALGLPAFRPSLRGPVAVPLGVLVGLCLFCILAGRPRVGRVPAVATVVRSGWLLAAAAFEEIVWRGVALAFLVPRSGPAAALAATTAGFALAHRTQGRAGAVHVVTGAGFGGAFLVAGLAAAVSAHVAYNVLVDLALRARRE
jgi:membrane protease YdiL (CAAX protease family)